MVLNHSCLHGWMHVGVIIFCSVRFLSEKNKQTEIFFKKKPKPNRNRFGLVFSVLARFFRFGSVFFGLGSVRFFGFLLIKPNRTSRFFKILIGFFFGSVFSVVFFFGFLGLIGFSVFLLTPICMGEAIFMDSMQRST